jgi:hypothetical protein
MTTVRRRRFGAGAIRPTASIMKACGVPDMAFSLPHSITKAVGCRCGRHHVAAATRREAGRVLRAGNCR